MFRDLIKDRIDVKGHFSDFTTYNFTVKSHKYKDVLLIQCIEKEDFWLVMDPFNLDKTLKASYTSFDLWHTFQEPQTLIIQCKKNFWFYIAIKFYAWPKPIPHLENDFTDEVEVEPFDIFRPAADLAADLGPLSPSLLEPYSPILIGQIM
jgi:hypothetical protein